MLLSLLQELFPRTRVVIPVISVSLEKHRGRTPVKEHVSQRDSGSGFWCTDSTCQTETVRADGVYKQS